jgi:lactoylglutathione lyase
MLTMIMVSDMERSVRFYRDVLGLKLKFQSPEWTEFDVDSTTLALHGGGKPQPAPAREQFAGTASIGFNVANLDSTCEELKRKGARMVLPPTEREGEGIKLAVFLDPDGLAVSFSQNVGR